MFVKIWFLSSQSKEMRKCDESALGPFNKTIKFNRIFFMDSVFKQVTCIGYGKNRVLKNESDFNFCFIWKHFWPWAVLREQKLDEGPQKQVFTFIAVKLQPRGPNSTEKFVNWRWYVSRNYLVSSR